VKRPRIFYGWWVVIATSIIIFYGAGTFFYGFGVFFNPIRKEFGWAAATTALAFSLYRLEGGIGAPIVGYLVDRFGPRRLMLFGTTVVGIGFLFLSRIDSLLTFYASFLVLSLGFSAGMGVVGQVAVANWFFRLRGRALGLMMIGAGAAGALAPLLAWLLITYGWRVSMVIIALGTWIICIPLATLVRHKPEQYGLLPDGDTADSNPGHATLQGENGSEADDGLSWQQSLKTRAFWFISIGAALSSAAISSVVIHMVPHLESVGIEPQRASLAITFLTVSSIAGRVGFGFLGDLMDKRYLLAVTFGMQAIGVLFFAFVQSFWMVIPFLIFFGPGYGGSIPLRPALMADYFGRKWFGTIQGLTQAVMTIGGIIGPYVAGGIFDATGSYTSAWLMFAGIVLAGIPFVLLAQPPKLVKSAMALSTQAKPAKAVPATSPGSSSLQ